MIKSTCRIALTLGLIAVSVVWIAHGLKLIPDASRAQLDTRLQFCESLALTASNLTLKNDFDSLSTIVQQMGDRSDGLKSIRVQYQDKTVASWGQHPADWSEFEKPASTPERMSIDILADGQPWGKVQVSYEPLNRKSGLNSIWLILFVGASVTLLGWFFLNRTLTYLNPSKVVPNRVRNAFDVITEGIVLQDRNGHIVMVNKAFSGIVGKSLSDLLGGVPDQFDWRLLEYGASQQDDASDQNDQSVRNHITDSDGSGIAMPWKHSLDNVQRNCGVMVALHDEDAVERKFIVNSTPLVEEDGKCRGALTSFQDVTTLEDKRQELTRMLQVLKTSRDEIRRQNGNLKYLASRDSLTGCFNRRSFFEKTEAYWSETAETDLSVIMLDIDEFKAINDNFGHGVGDVVIRGVAKLAGEVVGKQGIVCRFGGEEFCIALPNMEYLDALTLGEAIRAAVESANFDSVQVTFSVGVTSREFMAMDFQHMLEQADQSLYVAKNRGRNQVVGFSNSEDTIASESESQDGKSIYGDTVGFVDPVQHEAIVAALYSSLYYRDQAAAVHSARVANMCLAVAEPLMDESILSVMRIAALLHDIGRIGVGDSYVAHKPGQPISNEMAIRTSSIAEAICQSASVSEDVATVINNFQTPFGNGDKYIDFTATQPRISLCCRILAVCEAFDSIVNSETNVISRSPAEAIAQLKKQSPEYYDPELVELLGALVAANPGCMQPLVVDGASIDDSLLNRTEDFFAAVESGNLGPLRFLVKRLKREALSEGDDFQGMITKLEDSLTQNDREIQELFHTTQELLEMCRSRSGAESTVEFLNPSLDG